jgi:hypothetical protein
MEIDIEKVNFGSIVNVNKFMLKSVKMWFYRHHLEKKYQLKQLTI